MITYQCNVDCVYCYEKGKFSNKTMSIETAKKTIEKAFFENITVCEEIEFKTVYNFRLNKSISYISKEY
jgi:sulfatase maturation enzyme AslB (radical SAM superfamily)